MTNLMLVAGEKSEKLATFLKERGTFTVSSAFSNLKDNMDVIQNQIITVDKFVYVYVDNEGVSVREEMHSLKKLLTGSYFFNPHEIVLVVPSSGDSVDALSKYFKATMQESNFTNYTVKTITGVMNFAAIYDNLLGVSKNDDFDNTYRSLYRVERGSDVKRVYEPTDDFNRHYEPFDFQRITTYDKQKSVIRKVDSGTVVTDRESYVPKFEEPQFGKLDVQNKIAHPTVLVVSGRAASGKSVWSAVLAASAQAAEKKIGVLDFTDSPDVYELLKSSEIKCTECTPENLVKGEYDEELGVVVVRAHNTRQFSVLREFAQYVVTNSYRRFDTLLFVVEPADLDKIAEVMKDYTDKLLITSGVLQKELGVVIRTALDFNKSFEVVVVLNDNVCKMKDQNTFTALQLREVLPDKVRVVRPIRFDKIPYDSGIYNAIVSN